MVVSVYHIIYGSLEFSNKYMDTAGITVTIMVTTYKLTELMNTFKGQNGTSLSLSLYR